MNIRDLSFITENSIDKVFKTGTGTFSVPGGGNATTTVSHAAGKSPLFNVQWSLDNLTWYPVGHIDNQTYGPLSSTSVAAYTNNDNLYVYGSSNGGSTRTVYYKYELFFSEVSV